MQVLGLPGHVTRNAKIASLILSPRDPGVIKRQDIVRRWREAMKNGLSATDAARAVDVPRATLYRWQRRPEHLSTRPHRVRKGQSHEEARKWIKELRKRYPAWGRGKISQILRRKKIPISKATVGRLIRDMVNKGEIPPVSAFTRDSKKAKWHNRRPHAVRTKNKVKSFGPGDVVQIDTLAAALLPGRTIKHFTAIDTYSRWSDAMPASNATAASAARFLDQLIATTPLEIKAIQVDGGSEFMAEFEAACHAKGIKLFVLPPRSPKMNGVFERMQATWRNEFYNVQNTATTIEELNIQIKEHLKIYNGSRPHDALDGMTPNEYLKSQRIAVDL